MASPVIKIRRSSVQNNAPTAAQLELGELALNTYDGKLFTEINDGTVSIVEIGGHLNHLAATGISTFGTGSTAVVVGGATTSLLVRGDCRVVGVLTVGSGSITLDESTDTINVGSATTITTTGFQIGGNGVFVHSTGYNVGGTFLHNAGITGAGANLSGIITAVGLDISGNIDIDGTTNLDAVDIDGAVDMASSLTLAGNADFNGNLDVDGTANLDVVDIDGAVDMASSLTIAGNIDANGDLDVDGTTNLDVVDIDGAVDMASSLTLAGNADFNGNLDVSGDVDLGNATSDTITVTGRFDSNLLPSTDNVRDLGASDKEWRHLFVDGRTEIDNLNSVGIATFNNNAIHANIYSTGISTISGFRFPTSDGDEDQALVTDGLPIE